MLSNNGPALGDILTFEGGFAFKSETYLPQGKYKIVTIKNVQDGIIDTQGCSFVDDLPEKMKPTCVLHPGNVLISLTGYVGRTGIVVENDLLLNQRVAKIVPLNNVLLPILYFIFRQEKMKSALERISKGTAQQNLSPIEALQLRIPFEMNTLISLSSLARAVFDTIILNLQSNLQLVELRDTLLPKLMSGEIDVSAIDL